MSVHLGMRHDRLLRKQATQMFEKGRGYRLTARKLGMSAATVREWQKMYRVIGKGGLLAMGIKHTRYDYETKVAQIFSRTPNGCGHRQVAMCLRAEEGERIADKTVLKMMREMGLHCGIRRETNYHRYNSYKGDVGQSFANIIGRNFTATGPWQKLGTDVTEFKLSFGKAYLAPVYDFASKEIVAHSISMCPNLAQQQEMLQVLMDAKPEGAKPILHSDMGWQYQHETYISTLADNGFIQSMSRKGNCIDNGATEQVFGHIKDEFFRGQDWQTFESFKADLEAYITHWNTVRRQVRLKGLTPVEYRVQALEVAV